MSIHRGWAWPVDNWLCVLGRVQKSQYERSPVDVLATPEPTSLAHKLDVSHAHGNPNQKEMNVHNFPDSENNNLAETALKETGEISLIVSSQLYLKRIAF